MGLKRTKIGWLSALSVTIGLSLVASSAKAANLAILDNVQGEITLQHDPNFEFGAVSNGTPFGPGVAGSTTAPGESASFSGSWFVNNGGSPDPGTGVIYVVDDDNSNLVKAIITANWSTVVDPGFDIASISITVQSSACGGNLGPLPAAFASLGIAEPNGCIEISGSFRNPATAAAVGIPTNLSMQYCAAADACDIPTVSEWGLVILSLLLLTSAKVLTNRPV